MESSKRLPNSYLLVQRRHLLDFSIHRNDDIRKEHTALNLLKIVIESVKLINNQLKAMLKLKKKLSDFFSCTSDFFIDGCDV